MSANAATVAGLRQMFAYIFEPPRQKGGGLPQLSLFPLAGAFSLAMMLLEMGLRDWRISIIGTRYSKSSELF